MSQSDLTLLEVQMDQAKAAIKLSDDLKSLEQDPRFKKIILENFLEKEAVRVVKLKADPAMQSEGNQKDLDHRIIGIGELALFLRMIHQIGNGMRDSIEEMENTHDQIAIEMSGVN